MVMAPAIRLKDDQAKDADVDARRQVLLLDKLLDAKQSEYGKLFSDYGFQREHLYLKDRISTKDLADGWANIKGTDKEKQFAEQINILFRRWGTGDAGKYTVAMLIAETLNQGKELSEIGHVFLEKVEKGEMRTILDAKGERNGWKVVPTAPEVVNTRASLEKAKVIAPEAKPSGIVVTKVKEKVSDGEEKAVETGIKEAAGGVEVPALEFAGLEREPKLADKAVALSRAVLGTENPQKFVEWFNSKDYDARKAFLGRLNTMIFEMGADSVEGFVAMLTNDENSRKKADEIIEQMA